MITCIVYSVTSWCCCCWVEEHSWAHRTTSLHNQWSIYGQARVDQVEQLASVTVYLGLDSFEQTVSVSCCLPRIGGQPAAQDGGQPAVQMSSKGNHALVRWCISSVLFLSQKFTSSSSNIHDCVVHHTWYISAILKRWCKFFGLKLKIYLYSVQYSWLCASPYMIYMYYFV
jgi:hypothetical protein